MDVQQREFGWAIHIIERPNSPVLAMTASINVISSLGVAVIYNEGFMLELMSAGILILRAIPAVKILSFSRGSLCTKSTNCVRASISGHNECHLKTYRRDTNDCSMAFDRS
jgi:hypothetical protein